MIRTGERILSGALSGVALLALAGGPQQQSPQPGIARSSQSTAPAIAGKKQNSQRTQPATPLAAKPMASDVAGVSAREQALIAEVERTYQSGMHHYSAGDLHAARSDFDHAVDLMLTSSYDLKAGSPIGAEFDHVVDAVNTLELDSLKQGTGFAPPKQEDQAPVDVANDVTFPVDPNIKATAEAELKTTQSDLPLVINDAVAGYINFFSSTSTGRGTIINSLTRAGRYKALIQNVLKEEGVPQDLIYQAVAESGFRPQAFNARSGAGGMWQFMPYSDYGLTRTAWYDERFDPEKSTRAYAHEIKKMYNQLGDWYLAMAAYDWGPGNIQRAVQRTGYADFWELYRRNNLPAETKNYVPIILAATIMAKNPQQYGLSNLVPDPPLLFDTVLVTSATDLRLVSDIVSSPVQEIAALNPALLRTSTPPDQSYELHLPAGSKDLFARVIAEIPQDKRASWRYHKLQQGETLEEVARNYHVSPSEIAFVNQLQPSPDMSRLDALVIPVAPAASTLAQTRYRTQRGDTLVMVADKFAVTPEQLRRWNHLRSGKLTGGQTLFVAEPARVTARTRGHKRSRAPVRSARNRTSVASMRNVSSVHSGKARVASARTAASARIAHPAARKKTHSN